MVDAEVADGHIGRETNQETENSIYKKRPHTDEESCIKICGIFMDNIACRVTNPKVANIKNRNFTQFAKKEVGKFMNNYARKSDNGD